MPNISKRRGLLGEIEKLLEVEALLESSDSSCSNFSDNSHSDDDDWLYESDSEQESELLEVFMLIFGTRYLERPPRIDKSRDFVEHFFADLPPGLFRQLTRMEKASLSFLLSLINDHLIFKNDSQNPQAPVIVQLAVALDRFGHEGNGACLSRSLLLWGLGHGSLVNYTKRVMLELESKLSNVVSWPDVQQQRRISSEFAEKGFPGCVGLIDGTLLSLSQHPRFDGETYFDRKQNYSINA